MMDLSDERSNWLKLIKQRINDVLEAEVLGVDLKMVCVNTGDHGATYKIESVSANLGDTVPIKDAVVYDLIFDLGRASNLSMGESLTVNINAIRYSLEIRSGEAMRAIYNYW